MGSGSSKKQSQVTQPQAPRLAPVVESKPLNQSRPESPELPAVSQRRESVGSRVSGKQSVTNQTNGVEHRSPLHQLSSNTPRESIDSPLPLIDNPVKKANSRPSTRASSVIRPPPIKASRLDSHSSSASHKSFERKGSETPHKSFERKGSETSHKQAGRCSRCPHCQRTGYHSITSTPKPKWLTLSPPIEEIHIDMDKYDVEAVKKKIISRNGHLPGAYDYQPYLTIEQTDYDATRENYYTQPFIAKTKPRILPATTPFPEFELLQRREQRLNKPYTLPLFDN